MSRWDADRARKATHTAPERPTRCIECRGPLGRRYLYCSDQCSHTSRANQASQTADTQGELQ